MPPAPQEAGCCEIERIIRQSSPRQLSWADDYEDSEWLNGEIPLTPSTTPSDCQLRHSCSPSGVTRPGAPAARPQASAAAPPGAPGCSAPLRAAAAPFQPALVRALGAGPFHPRGCAAAAEPAAPGGADPQHVPRGAGQSAAALQGVSHQQQHTEAAQPPQQQPAAPAAQRPSAAAGRLPAALLPAPPRCAPFAAATEPRAISWSQRPRVQPPAAALQQQRLQQRDPPVQCTAPPSGCADAPCGPNQYAQSWRSGCAPAGAPCGWGSVSTTEDSPCGWSNGCDAPDASCWSEGCYTQPQCGMAGYVSADCTFYAEGYDPHCGYSA